MRIDVRFHDRVGIAHEILAVLARRHLNVVAVEVEPPHVYIDVPGLAPGGLPALAEALADIPDVLDTRAIDLLPGARRRLHLDAVLSALADPVLAIDAEGTVVVANAAAAAVAGLPPNALTGRDLGQLFGNETLSRDLLAAGFRLPTREVMLNGQPFMIDVRPVSEAPGNSSGTPAATGAGTGIAGPNAADVPRAVGGVVTLHTPSRIGERLHALQNFDAAGFDTLLGDSPPMRALKARAVRVAGVDAPLLILGETGTGKELIAQACHQASTRSTAPFLALNCAALPESIAESELFGYAPGAFTGAQRGGKPGLLELANPGTVFLDEVGELSPYLQAKLLRFLNDGRFRRVGGDRELQVDVRIISATHRDLPRMVADRSFREDLYYRLNVLNLHVPPLRDRAEDILLLATHFIARAAAQTRRPASRLTPQALALLLDNPWPGNVRQLENVLFRAVTLCDGTAIDAGDLELASSGVRPGESSGGVSGDESWDEAAENFERDLLTRLYPRYPSSRKLAARLKTSHTTIANKLRKYGIPQR